MHRNVRTFFLAHWPLGMSKCFEVWNIQVKSIVASFICNELKVRVRVSNFEAVFARNFRSTIWASKPNFINRKLQWNTRILESEISALKVIKNISRSYDAAKKNFSLEYWFRRFSFPFKAGINYVFWFRVNVKMYF